MVGPLNCTGCGECCKWITFIVATPPGQGDEFLDFYRTRGAKTEVLPEGQIAVTVSSICPYLIEGRAGCGVHESMKPALCKNYDCRTDPFIKGGKYYNG